MIALGLSLTSAYAQSSEEKSKANEDRVKALVESREFTFVANSAQPLNANEINRVIGQMQGMAGGAQINLAEQGYQLSLSKNNLSSHLPYYGRAFSAPIGNSDRAGFKFDSKDYNITQKVGKKGEINLNITPKDQAESIRMMLSIAKSGMANLTVSSNVRQSISYIGYIKGNGSQP